MKGSNSTFGILLATLVLVCLFFGNLAAEKAADLDRRSEDLLGSVDDSDVSDPYTTEDDDAFESDFDTEDVDDEYDEEDEEYDEDDDDWEHELEIEFAELELARNQVEQAVELASDDIKAAVYGIDLLQELAAPEVAKTELGQLLNSATDPAIRRAIQLGLIRVNLDLDDSKSAIDIAKQLVVAK